MRGMAFRGAAFLLYAVLSVLPSESTIQEDIKHISTYLGVKYQVIANVNNDIDTFDCRVTLTNDGRNGVSIQKGQWEIYFTGMYMVEPKHLFTKGNDGYEIPGTHMKVLHVNGGLFKFVPTDDFEGIGPGESLEMNFQTQYWSVARTDALPNWYVADTKDTSIHASIRSTQTEHLTSFTGDWDTEKKWKRASDDLYNPWTPSERWERYNIEDLGIAPKPVIPTPQNEDEYKDEYILKPLRDWIVYYVDESLSNEANILRDKFGWQSSTTTEPSREYVKLVINPKSSPKDEGYELKIESDRISITAPSDSGIFYGIQTLISILENDTASVQSRTIKDWPRYDYRGMHVDVARHFVSQEDILKLIKVMGMYKLNKLHFHVTDDEGWRVEMPWCPYLTSVGGRQCHDLMENDCLLPQFGSDSDGKDKGSGYYTADQYKEILSYAADNHIEVIPEVDMPGHARAAIKATEAYLNAAENGPGLADPKSIQLSDPEDKSFYHSTQLYTDNAINPCINSSYKFVEMVVSQFVEYHRGIQPLKTMHLGGDEVAKGAWVNSTHCSRLLEDYLALNDSEDLTEYFVHRISEIVKTVDENLTLGLWEDGAITSDEEPFDKSQIATKNVLVNSWQNIWEWGVANRAYKLANAGYKVVMSQATHTYFDHPNEPDPEERGLYWATRFTDTQKTFGFLPDDLYANAETTRFGEPYTEEIMCEDEESDVDCTPLDSPENIIGLQGQLWTETIRTSDQFFGNVFPRLMALAERAWHNASWETNNKEGFLDDWKNFANTVGYKELRRLDDLGVAYRVPVAGAKMANGLVEINAEFPGLEITYSSADKPFRWSKYLTPIEITADTYVQVRSSDDTRGGRVILISRGSLTRPNLYIFLFSILLFALGLS